MTALCGEVENGVGVVLVAEEFLTAELDTFIPCIRGQPVWSDLSTLVLSRTGIETPRLSTALQYLGNVSVIERPVRITTLLTIVRSALRGRERQYEVRELLQNHEISERELRNAETSRVQLLEAERAARSDAERAGRMKDEFLATLSHELRTPLNAILGWSTILSIKPPTEDDLANGLRTIERNARAQTQIIEDLLDMSGIISGKVRLDVKRVTLASVVQAAVETVRPTADAKGVKLSVVLDQNMGFVNGDANRLQQVFWNLLTNAVKFTPRENRIQVVLERVNSSLQVSVADTGQGIEPTFLPYVFDRFRQADATITRSHGGLGLGLAIVKQLVELHGGKVGVSSEGVGKGATFTVLLPIIAVNAGKTAVLPDLRREPSESALRANYDDITGISVLVVDDEPDSRALVKRLMEDCHARVTSAASAPEAFELLQHIRPDVLVSDIGMPNEDGYSLIRRVRGLHADAGGRTPAIALTAYARGEDRVTAMRAGFQHHMSKPVDPSELIAVIASLARNAPHPH